MSFEKEIVDLDEKESLIHNIDIMFLNCHTHLTLFKEALNLAPRPHDNSGSRFVLAMTLELCEDDQIEFGEYSLRVRQEGFFKSIFCGKKTYHWSHKENSFRNLDHFTIKELHDVLLKVTAKYRTIRREYNLHRVKYHYPTSDMSKVIVTNVDSRNATIYLNIPETLTKAEESVILAHVRSNKKVVINRSKR